MTSTQSSAFGHDVYDHAQVSAQERLNAAFFANQRAALELENARLYHELMLTRLQSQYMSSMPFGTPGFHGGYMYPQTATQMGFSMQCHEAPIPKVAKKQVKKKQAPSRTQEPIKTHSFETASTASGEESTSPLSQVASDDEHEVEGSGKGSQQQRTTVMLRNVPKSLTTEKLMDLLNDAGFEGCYDLVYLPRDFKTKVGLGYAFVNLNSAARAGSFFESFQGFSTWGVQSDKVCDVAWSVLQGIDENVERYRNSPVMHESVSDEFKPVLVENNEKVAFPAPTKHIRPPRQWSRRT